MPLNTNKQKASWEANRPFSRPNLRFQSLPRAAGDGWGKGKQALAEGPASPLHPPPVSAQSQGRCSLGKAARRQRFSSSQGTPCPWTILFCKKQEEVGEAGQLWRRRDQRSPARNRQSLVTGPPHDGHGECSYFCCFRGSRVATGRGRSPAAHWQQGERRRSLLL